MQRVIQQQQIARTWSSQEREQFWYLVNEWRNAEPERIDIIAYKIENHIERIFDRANEAGRKDVVREISCPTCDGTSTRIAGAGMYPMPCGDCNGTGVSIDCPPTDLMPRIRPSN